MFLKTGQNPWHRPVVLKTGHPKARAWSSGWSRQVGDLAGLPPLREAEVREGTGHKNPQPTRPERNAQAADLDLPPEDDAQEMCYRHDEKQRGGHRHVGFSVQSVCLSALTTRRRPLLDLI
jgi:hypothetical protein